MSFRAKFLGTCVECLDPIEIGDLIRLINHCDREYAHAHCAPTPTVPTAHHVPQPLCARCHMYHRGECL